MEIIGGIVLFVLATTVVLVALGLVVFLYSILTKGPSNGGSFAPEQPSGQMNEGDFHSGPGGYSPNTAYPETFYGSGSSDSHDEGDFNR